MASNRNSQVHFDPIRQAYFDESGNSLNPFKHKGAEGINDANKVYAPDLEKSFDISRGALYDYLASTSEPFEKLEGLDSEIKKVGPYQAFDWKIPDYEYKDYEVLQGYERPELERTQFSGPQIRDVEDLEPIAEGLYDARMAEGRERTSQQFADTRQRMMDELRRSRSRPEQAAALLAQLGRDEETAQTRNENAVRFQQGQEKLGLAQRAQELGINRDVQASGLNLQTQQSQADERSRAAQQLLANQQFEQGERRYGYEQDIAKDKFDLGMQQWLQEQQANERAKAYDSRYGMAQDMTELRKGEWEANRAAHYDHLNAKLQGQNAATNQASQAATYYTNLSQGERKDARNYEAQRRKEAEQQRQQ